MVFPRKLYNIGNSGKWDHIGLYINSGKVFFGDVPAVFVAFLGGQDPSVQVKARTTLRTVFSYILEH